MIVSANAPPVAVSIGPDTAPPNSTGISSFCVAPNGSGGNNWNPSAVRVPVGLLVASQSPRSVPALPNENSVDPTSPLAF
ncbi:MAG: hypothetical protein R3B68_12135 [Phycisphaerales bacterium]